MSGERIQTVLVAEPEDASFDGQAYLGSGHFIAHRLVEEFAKYANKADIAAAELSDRDALIAASRRAGDAYLVVPRIVLWEQRVKGIPSRARIRIVIVSVASGQEIVSTLLEGETGAAILKETSPNALAIDLIRDFVRRLYVR